MFINKPKNQRMNFETIHDESSTSKWGLINVIIKEICIGSDQSSCVITDNVAQRYSITSRLGTKETNESGFPIISFHLLGESLWQCSFKRTLRIFHPLFMGMLLRNECSFISHRKSHSRWAEVHSDSITNPLHLQ